MIVIRPAQPGDTPAVCSVLHEAAEWLIGTGQPLWCLDEIAVDRIGPDVLRGLNYLGEMDREPAGVMRFQLDDPDFWPEVVAGTSTFVHRLAVRRKFAGAGISTALLDFAVQRTRELQRSHLRLDCEASRPKLRALYEHFGFRYHSDHTAGPYHVARYEYQVTGSP